MTELFEQEIERDNDWYLKKERKGRLRADLETFVTEETLDHKYLYWLEPTVDCVWEIRSIREMPSVRVLGLFPEKDVFVATGIYRRDYLGKIESEEWKMAKRNAMAQWRSIFNQYQPLGKNGEEIHEFFSGALPGKYFKS
ncbi:MAG: hypothetical protein CMN56_09770 [Sneathiella sp.]|uniref:hypothetical protein n=1 Tax=Sneathiella sp. TaxID=1964365 RepID=UPI000C43C2A5|nr:hypothetical protein [Sneathiella sp.]MAZ03414.1 hypothetical protein [Sneathiella sp.]|tara:strand:+ start:318 stop:737 length:420 start_codon:yes stop_codon:yes gene_type:complete